MRQIEYPGPRAVNAEIDLHLDRNFSNVTLDRLNTDTENFGNFPILKSIHDAHYHI